MSEIGDIIQEKCLAFSDRVIRLNDYLLEQASPSMADVRKHQTSSISPHTSDVIPHSSSLKRQPSHVPVHLKSVAALSNQLLRSGTSIGANNAEATSAISKADFKSKSYIALKEARESLYWLELLYRNNYLDEEEFNSIYTDCEELVKLLVHRCKKLDEQLNKDK